MISNTNAEIPIPRNAKDIQGNQGHLSFERNVKTCILTLRDKCWMCAAQQGKGKAFKQQVRCNQKGL